MGLLDRLRRVSGIPAGAPRDMTAQAAMIQSGQTSNPSAGPLPQSVLDALHAEGMDTTALFAPGTPLHPFTPLWSDPRAWNFQAGYNIGVLPRSREVGRPSFDSILALAQN